MFELLLALAAPINPSSMDSAEVERELSTFVNRARAGALLHSLSHYQCDSAARKQKIKTLHREYSYLEHAYERLGGVFPDPQEIVLETHHYTCGGGLHNSKPYWEKTVIYVENELSKMRTLLSQKVRIMRKKRPCWSFYPNGNLSCTSAYHPSPPLPSQDHSPGTGHKWSPQSSTGERPLAANPAIHLAGHERLGLVACCLRPNAASWDEAVVLETAPDRQVSPEAALR